MNKLFVFGIVSLSLLQSGCSTPNEEFDCASGKGVGCKSITHINALIDRGVLGGTADDIEDDLLRTKVSSLDRPASQRIWVAPHEEESGREVLGSYIELGD